MSLIWYIIDFKNKQGDEVRVKITDYENYDPLGDNPITTINLTGVAPAFELETFNVNEDKFSTILGQRATIRFKSTNAVNFSTFSTGFDNRFFVQVTINGGTQTIFFGWLLMDDNQQAYLPPGQPVVIYATDGLGLLKDIELSDFNGARPKGKYRLIEIIAWCLNKTEVSLNTIDGIKVACNLFENNMVNVNNCPLNQTYVDVKTFEKSIDEFEDCFTVLDKILFSIGARLCYYNNYWYIIRIDEYKGSAFYLASYSPGGVYQSRILGHSLDKSLDGNIDFVNADTIQRIQRANKSASIKSIYKFPEEIPDNVNFLRGSVIDDVLPTKTFTLDDWTKVRVNRATNIEDTNTSIYAYIQRRYNSLEYETERFCVITIPNLDINYREGVNSNPIPVCAGDKFSFSLSWRVETTDISGTDYLDLVICDIYVNGDDGSRWFLGNTLPNGSGVWMWSNTSVSSYLSTYVLRLIPDQQDEREWQKISINYDDIPEIPVTGSLIIRLMALNQNMGTRDDLIVNYSDLKFEYIPKINGSYKKVSGEQFKMSTTGAYSKKTEHEYYLFDAPCKLFKGAMFYKLSGSYYLTSNWFDQAMGVYDIPGLLNSSYRFCHWQTYYLWNQLRTETRILECSLYGFDTANNYAGLIHKYSILNAIYPLTVEQFIVLSMRQDWHNCIWTATIAQINNNDQPRQGGGKGENFEFKYLD